MKKGKLGLLSVSMSMVTALFAGINFVKESPEEEIRKHGVPVRKLTKEEIDHPIYAQPFEVYDSLATDNTKYKNGYQDCSMDILGTGTNMEDVWNAYRGDGTTIAIIDTGIDYDNPDFKFADGTSKILDTSRYYYVNSNNEIAYNQYGVLGTSSYNFLDHSTWANDGKLQSHGTNVASTAASAINGNGGCVGIAPNAKLLILKTDMNFSSIASAIDYARSQKVDVINMSLGAYGTSFTDGNGVKQTGYSSVPGALTSVINSAYNAGIIVVAAAGNEKTSIASYPANNTHVIGVGALASGQYSSASFSNFNPSTSTSSTLNVNVDLSAPGYVYAADETATNSSGTPTGRTHGFKNTQGTSFASPIVAGAAALWKQAHPTGTPAQFESALYAACDDIGTSGWDTTYGHGALNIKKLLLSDSTSASSISIKAKDNVTSGKKDDHVQLYTQTLPLNTVNKDVTWSTSDSSIASVNGYSNVLTFGSKGGTATITATDTNNSNAKGTIQVTNTEATGGTETGGGSSGDTQNSSTEYVFTSKQWADSTSSWSGSKDGNQLDATKGVQVTGNSTATVVTSKESISNISKIAIKLSKSSNGVGTVTVKVGNDQVLSQTSFSGDVAEYTTSDFASTKSGKVSITIACSTSSIYVKSITITTSGTGGGEGSDTETSAKYLFTNSKWNPWTSVKDGAGYSNSGVQVTANGTGANANSTKSFNNVKKAIVTYCTNASSGAGTITVKIGSTELGSFNVTTSGGTTARTNEITSTTALSGVANISVSCSANSIYVCGIEIFEGGSGDTPTPTPTNYTVSFNPNGGLGTMTDATTNGSSYIVPACTFTRENYNFDKWALGSATGTKYSVDDTITGISSNITLYATWSPKETSTPDFGDYYKSITATSGMTLLGQLHTLMANTHDTYTSYSDCSDPTYIYFTDPGSTIDYVTDFYTQKDIGVDWGAGDVGTWNREHVWCQSLSVSESTGTQLWGTTYGGSDLQHVRPVETTLNSSRNNNPYGVLSDFGYNKNNYKTYAKDKNKNITDLGGYVVSKSSNFAGVFEPLDSAKGDVARILMYVYMHYSNQTTGSDSNTSLSGHTTDLSIRKIVNTSANTDQAAWDLLLAWNAADEVSEAERTRNNEAASVQGNRNPFIDHPEYAEAIWGSSTPVKVLEKIEVKNPQTSYLRNETFVKPSVIAAYKDGSSVDVKDAATFTGFDSSTIGEKTILVSYSENGINKETSYKINVSLPETTKITITRNSIGSMSNSYNWYAINEDGITGKAYSYPSNSGIQINGKSNSNKGIFTSNDYGYIKSIKIVKSTSTTSDREIIIKGSNDKYSESNYSSGTELGSKVITTSGTTWTSEDNFKYISLYSSDSVIIESIEITYGLTPMDIVSKVTSISLDKTTQSFDLKDRSSFTLTPTVAYTGSPDTTVTWISSNTSVATVSKSSGSKNEQITVTALSAGTATITASCGGIPASCTVTITDTREVVSSITVNPATLSLEEGQSSKLEATINGSNITTGAVVAWTSSNSSVATVDSSGTVNAVSVGNATISASYGGQSGSCVVTVTEKATPTPTPSGGYTLVTNASDLSAGDQILIVAANSGNYYALAPYENGNNCGQKLISAPVNNTINTDVACLTLGGSSDGWTLFDGTYYLYAAGGTGKNNYLKGAENADSDNAKWSISIDDSSNATIKTIDSAVARNTIMYNAGSDLFSCYANGQTSVKIYKKSSGSVTPTPDKQIVSIAFNCETTSLPYGKDSGSSVVQASLIATYEDNSTGEVTPTSFNYTVNTYVLGNHEISATYNGQEYTKQIIVTNSGANIGIAEDQTIEGTEFKKSMNGDWKENGAGSDYTSHSPYLLKMDDDGDYFEYSPSDFVTTSKSIETTADVKMVGGGTTSSFAVKALVKDDEGNIVVSDTICGTLTVSGNQNDTLSLTCTLNNAEGVEIYGIRYIFTKGSNVGVGGATIKIQGGVDNAAIEKQVKAWSDYFLSNTDPICSANPNGENVDSLSSVWGTLSQEYGYMNDIAKEMFFSSSDSTISAARDRYMHIASHYGASISNFASAKVASKNVLNLFGDLQALNKDNSANFLVAILGLVGVASIGGYFIIKKRKEI